MYTLKSYNWKCLVIEEISFFPCGPIIYCCSLNVDHCLLNYGTRRDGSMFDVGGYAAHFRYCILWK